MFGKLVSRMFLQIDILHSRPVTLISCNDTLSDAVIFMRRSETFSTTPVQTSVIKLIVFDQIK